MTQNTTTVEPQPLRAAELWTVYQVQWDREAQLRQRWFDLSGRFLRASERASSAYDRSREAYDVYQAAQQGRVELFELYRQAEQAERAGNLPAGAWPAD
jgi:hypothetical protein